MGQLERYGLYVLCVVIVLILGVAIWGGDAPPPGKGPAEDLGRALASAGDVTAQDAAGLGAAPGVGVEQGFFDRELPNYVEPIESVENELQGVAIVDEPQLRLQSEAEPQQPPAGSGSTRPANQREPMTHALRTYKVRADDTMEKIARDVLGDKQLVQRIRELNPGVDPRRMRIGSVLKLPVRDEATRVAPEPAGRESWREYVVEKGDSAYKISKAMYGTTKHAKRILQANGISDPKKLRPKTVLKIPPLQ